MTEETDPVYLSLDDVIRLNKVKNMRSGSVRSFGSNRSNRSHYSNRSYGGMSNRSYGSNYSNRSRGSRGKGSYYNHDNRRDGNSFRFSNGRGFRRDYDNRNNNSGYSNQSRSTSLHTRSVHDRTDNFARNRVSNALKFINKSSEMGQRRFHPYNNDMRRTFAVNVDPEPEEITISVNNNISPPQRKYYQPRLHNSRLTVNGLAQFNKSNISPLHRSQDLSSDVSRVESSTRGIWGPKLDMMIQKEILDHTRSSDSRLRLYSVEELNNCKITVSTTLETLHDRFASYL